jgi:hypothetical protein
MTPYNASIPYGIPASPSGLEPPHKPAPNLHVDDTAHSERRHNPTNSRNRTHPPIPQDLRSPLPHLRIWPIVQIQPEQMQRRTRQLHRRRRHKLCNARTAHVAAHRIAHVCFKAGRKHRRQVEGCEYCHAVADREERECRQRHGTCGRRAEELCEFVIFVEAQREVRCRGCKELGRAGRGGRCGCGMDGRRDGIDGVGGEVGAKVEALRGNC